MNVTNCKGCGRIFNVIGNEKLCPNCRKKMEDKFAEVKAFLQENPNTPIDVVSKETEVSTRQIRQWVKEERLILSEGIMDGVVCESCGKAISTGRFCDKCKASLTNNLRNAFAKESKSVEVKKDRDGDRMRFLNK